MFANQPVLTASDSPDVAERRSYQRTYSWGHAGDGCWSRHLGGNSSKTRPAVRS